MPYRLSELAARLKAPYLGEDVEVFGLNALELATPKELSFVESRRRLKEARASKAGALLAPPALKDELSGKSLILVSDPRLALARIGWLFYEERRPKPGISPLAFVAEGARVAPSAAVLPFVYVGEGAEIGEEVVLYPGVFVGEGARVGEGAVLYPNVVLYPGTRVGRRVIIHAGAVIGADGFGFAFDGEKHLKIPHFGRVEIGDEVEIGANTTVDRATFGRTVVGDGAKLDNLIQVAHNVHLGRASVFAAQVGISGSVKVGDYVMVGGQAGLNNHVGDRARVAAKAGVAKPVPPGGAVAGIPALEIGTWRRCVALFERLPQLFKELRNLREKFSALKEVINGRKGHRS